MSIKVFSERFNQELNALGYPRDISSRSKAVSSNFKISLPTAVSIINGAIIPNNTIVTRMANEFGVLPEWLLGETEKKR